MIHKFSGNLEYLQSALISAPHLFTTRLGGVSEGAYATLNTSFTVGDKDENVHENLSRVAGTLGFAEGDIVCLKQIHSAICVRVGKEQKGAGIFKEKIPFQADAVTTNEKGVLLLVRSSDCTPILLYDKNHNAVCAIHSGWRGTLADIVGASVRKMEEEYGTKGADICAAIGPCISKESFEVGDEVATVFESAGYAVFVDRTSYEKPHIDIPAICAYQLERCGVTQIETAGECTKINNAKYFSHRAQGAVRGLLAAVIATE